MTNTPSASGASQLRSRFRSWRWKHGFLTGRWTQEEVDRHYAKARQMRVKLGLICSTCEGEFDSSPCSLAVGWSGHTVWGGCADNAAKEQT